jgi:U3 small nucleolar RNA-associated protein MPP10
MDSSPDIPLPLELQSLSDLLEECPETLALGSQDLQATALNATKYAFDLCKLFDIQIILPVLK